MTTLLEKLREAAKVRQVAPVSRKPGASKAARIQELEQRLRQGLGRSVG